MFVRRFYVNVKFNKLQTWWHEKSRPHSCRGYGTVIENPFNHRRLRLRSTSLVESSGGNHAIIIAR